MTNGILRNIGEIFVTNGKMFEIVMTLHVPGNGQDGHRVNVATGFLNRKAGEPL